MNNLQKGKLPFLFFVFLLSWFFAFSQSPQQARVDSMIQNLPTTKDSVYHFKLRNIAHFHPNLDSSYHYIQESFTIAKELDSKDLLLKSYMEMGKWYFKQGQYQASIPFFDSSFFFAQVVENPVSKSIALGIKANALGLIGEIEEAKNTYSDALDICNSHNLTDQAAILYMRLGDFHGMQGDYEKAIPLIKKADHLLDSLGMFHASCNCKYSLASSQLELVENKEEYYPIIELLEEVVSEKCQRFSNPGTLAAAYSGLGNAYGHVGQHTRAEKYIQEGLKRARVEKYVPIITFALGNAAIHYARIKNKPKALESMLEAEQLAKDIDFVQTKTELVKQKSTMYTYLGEVDNAIKATKEYLTIKNDQITEENLLAMEELNIKYNSLQQEKEITQQNLNLANQKSRFNKFLLFGSLITIGLLSLLFWYSVRLKNKKRDAQYLEEINQLKATFFANISHEFRTPLTLILAPLQKYFRQTEANATSEASIPQQEIAAMMRNAGQLQSLIDQLLDLSRLESKEMSLNTKAVSLDNTFQQVTDNFIPLAQHKNIRFQLEQNATPIKGYFDQEKVEIMITNILSNALKFTPEGGTVKAALSRQGKRVEIKISDNGKGISKEQLPHIFERFYQGDSSTTRLHGGSGIGLALAKELALLHGGDIDVESQLTKGTTFLISLPYSEAPIIDAPKSDAITSRRDQLISDLNAATLFLPTPEELEEQSNEGLPKVLIVEDHEDMRRFIKQELQDSYHILEADNGKTAFEIAKKQLPDLIISDIMMPGKGQDGLSLTKALKEEFLTSHIPVILLTAKASNEDQITGLEKQADAYMIKPFNPAILSAKVDNLIKQRKKLKILFAESIQVLPQDLPVTSQEEAFMLQVVELIEQHLADENFGVEQMSNGLNVDRTQLYRKVKALTGKSPSQLLKEMRLHRAKHLLENKATNVSQTAHAVGYRDLAYFSKSFKKEFGVNPRDILKKA